MCRIVQKVSFNDIYTNFISFIIFFIHNKYHLPIYFHIISIYLYNIFIINFMAHATEDIHTVYIIQGVLQCLLNF